MKERKKTAFGMTDLFLILLAVLSVVGIVRRIGVFRAEAGSDLREHTVSAVWRGADARSAACLFIGETVYTAAGEAFGEITDAAVSPHRAVLREDGDEVTAEWPRGTLVDIALTVRVRGAVRDGVFLRENGRAVLVGETYRLYSRAAAPTLLIRSISPLK